MNPVRVQQRLPCQGYSLIELLLTTALLLLFAGLAVVSLRTLSQGSALTEGAIRFQTLLRFARAEAAYTGRRVRVNFVQETNQLASTTTPMNSVQLTWEPNPAVEPDVFRDLPSTQWGVEQVNETVGIESVRFTDSESVPTGADEDLAAAADLSLESTNSVGSAWITFNPDGSCDSAEITLAGRNPEDTRRVAVRVEGFSGTVTQVETSETEDQGNQNLITPSDAPDSSAAGELANQ